MRRAVDEDKAAKFIGIAEGKAYEALSVLNDLVETTSVNLGNLDYLFDQGYGLDLVADGPDMWKALEASAKQFANLCAQLVTLTDMVEYTHRMGRASKRQARRFHTTTEEAIYSVINKKLGRQVDREMVLWFEDDPMSEIAEEFDRLYGDWVTYIVKQIYEAIVRGDGDVSSIDAAAYPAQLAQVLIKVAPPGVTERQIRNQLEDFSHNDAMLEEAFEDGEAEWKFNR